MTTTEAETVRHRVIRLSADHLGPLNLAEAVLAELGEDDLRPALAEILPAFCQTILATIGSRSRSTEVAEQSTRSRNVDALRKWHVGFLGAQVTLSGNVRKRMSECTEADLIFAANARRDIADKTMAQAKRLERLAKALADFGVEKVEDLPADVARKIMVDGAE